MKARLLGGIAALVVAVIGTVMLIFYVQGADKRALANTETEDVYVIKKEIPAGTSAANFGDSIVKKPVPKSAIAPDSVKSLSDLGGKVSSVELVPGEQLLASRMIDKNALVGRGRVEVPTGLQEVTIKLPIERVVGGALSAGDTVGVMLSVKENEKSNAPDQTQLTFRKVLVTAVQDASGSVAEGAPAEGESSGALTGNKNSNQNGGLLVTLARPDVDVERIVYTAEFGTIYLSKEPKDATEGTSGVLDRGRLFK
ncbi:Flp pilus assembly protein CpaB [Paenarthrobacter ureafaciens]|uniref:Flp pilus assembly protein CpaB n=1 Tax=Paenarthrobacter ureafaciens TaxID=37931 RepID=UPI00140C8B7B|nr:RcpC/CpaB family pilus assembly protein [Paenarthrobacter ureafaciens]MCX8453264.1 RcpC/CpaB family pilus assembly protein [Paenarthrobacter ureafaciens]MCY0972845.1 RcpC/CpaB family pilus assembly protein [Paenarthrobacter ureafaciens]